MAENSPVNCRFHKHCSATETVCISYLWRSAVSLINWSVDLYLKLIAQMRCPFLSSSNLKCIVVWMMNFLLIITDEFQESACWMLLWHCYHGLRMVRSCLSRHLHLSLVLVIMSSSISTIVVFHRYWLTFW